MAKRDARKDAIRTLVRNESLRTQRDLVERLQAKGFDCTQATVSRDIADMGLVKSEGGFYALPHDMALKRLVGELGVSVEEAVNLVVLKTRPGSASMLGETIDNAEIDGLVGTIAGDNTILIVAKTEARAAEIAELLKTMIR